MAAAKNEESKTMYTKADILNAKRFANRKDALNALLEDMEMYTLEEVDKKLASFMKGKVN